ncbi:MAG: N-acetyltransferase family protein [Micrococcales bacterium]
MPLDSESRWRLVRKNKEKGLDKKVELDYFIRDATVEDLAAICEIYNFYIANSVVTFDIDALKVSDWQEKFHWIKGLNFPFVVAQSDGGQVLGFAYVGPWRQKAAYKRTVENSIYLRPAATGKRVGSKLLEVLINKSREVGIKEIVAVISDKGAESSIALHESFGFKSQGHLAKVGFKFGRWLGVVMLQKSI